ncbi:MAG: TRAP transporter substrate-binding protein DctP [bacterium]|nr:MAG: TRAP transporter substrate-binding protein DctP [bacterium]
MIRFFTSFKFFVITSIFSILILPLPGISGKSITIKMATLAPNGSPWHEILKDMAVNWSEISNGGITLRIYPGGVAGDEGDMVRKMRIGQLQAAALTTAGLAKITPDVNALAIPLAIDSWETLNRVRDSLAPRLENTLEEEGFIVLNWGDAGWVRFFVPEPSPDVKTVRKAKLFTWAGDDKSIQLWKNAGFNVVPLAATDILPGLQSGMINAYNSSTMLSLASQWFPFTPYMIDLPWAPLVGATIVNKSTWNKIPDDLKIKLKQSAIETGERLQGEIRKLEDRALEEMVKRGLTVITPNEQQMKEWKEVIYEAYPKIRGDYIPADLFDQALKVANSVDRVDEQE